MTGLPNGREILDLELSGFRLPDSDALPRRRFAGKTGDADALSRYDFHTLFYDCFQPKGAGQIVMVGPKLLNLRAVLAEIEFEIDGTPLPAEALMVENKSRCSVMTLTTPGQGEARTLTLRHRAFGANIPIGRDLTGIFEQKNVLYGISKDNNLDWVKDWATWHVQEHGANAVVLTDNASTAYTPAQLREALADVEGLEAIAILRARYPFGPRGVEDYGALFLQRSMMELARQRLLLRARAVAITDIDELFYSPTGHSIFDATAEDPTGYVRANAQWVYPDPATPEASIRHRAHLYRSATGKPKTNRKYAVAPAGPQAGQQWLTHFLFGRKDPVSDFQIWHFRSVSRHWKYDRSAEFPELQPYPELADAMNRVFPRQADEDLATPALAPGATRPRSLIITAMKNEASFILEWVAFHRAIGFDDFLVYTNDCTDQTDELLSVLEDENILHHEHNEVLKRGPQKSALLYAQDHEAVDQADWILVSDIDEFLNIKIGDGHIDRLLEALPEADAIPVTWKLFGPNTRTEYECGLVIEQFTDAELPIEEGGLPRRYVKTLFRKDARVERFGTHGPILPDGVSFNWIAPDGRRLGPDDNPTRPHSQFSYHVAQMNHYAVGSVDAFLVKRDRGRVNHYRQTMNQSYWKKMARGGAEDSSILRHVEATRAEMERLLEIPGVRHLHEAGIAWRRARIRSLVEDEEFAHLRRRLIRDLKVA